MPKTISMLNDLACIIETGDSGANGAYLETLNVTDDFMLLTLKADDGTEKTFQVVEIDP